MTELAPLAAAPARTPGDCVTDLMAELDAAIARRDETPMVYVPPTTDLPDQEDA